MQIYANVGIELNLDAVLIRLGMRGFLGINVVSIRRWLKLLSRLECKWEKMKCSKNCIKHFWFLAYENCITVAFLIQNLPKGSWSDRIIVVQGNDAVVRMSFIWPRTII